MRDIIVIGCCLYTLYRLIKILMDSIKKFIEENKLKCPYGHINLVIENGGDGWYIKCKECGKTFLLAE